MTHYIYLIHLREFIKTNENIYKIGKTKQENNKRFNQYPKGSKILIYIICDNCDALEKDIIKIFKNKYNHRKDIGTEYFEGNFEDMIKDIYDIRKEKVSYEQNEILTTFKQNKYNKKIETIIDWLIYTLKNNTLSDDSIRNLYISYSNFIEQNNKKPISETKFGIILKNNDKIIPFNIGTKIKTNKCMLMKFDLINIKKYLSID